MSEHVTEAEKRVIRYETDAYSVYTKGSYNKAHKPNYGTFGRGMAGDNRGAALKGESNSKALKEFDVVPYGDFKKYPYDNLSGHELLQNAWLESNGKAIRGKGLSLENPAMALYENPMHKFITGQQRTLSLNKKNLAGTSWRKNVLDNIQYKHLFMLELVI